MDALPINDEVTLPGWELWFTASRSGGAGGQHVNTTSSKVTLCWCPASSSVFDDAQKARLIHRLSARINDEGVLLIHCDENRSQVRNLELARQRLAELLRGAMRRPRPRVATRVPEYQKRIRVADKRERGVIKAGRKPPGEGGAQS